MAVLYEEEVGEEGVAGEAVCEVLAGDVPLLAEELPVDLGQ